MNEGGRSEEGRVSASVACGGCNLYDFTSQTAPRPMMFPTADRRWKPLPELSVEYPVVGSLNGLKILRSSCAGPLRSPGYRRASSFDSEKHRLRFLSSLSGLGAGDICYQLTSTIGRCVAGRLHMFYQSLTVWLQPFQPCPMLRNG